MKFFEKCFKNEEEEGLVQRTSTAPQEKKAMTFLQGLTIALAIASPGLLLLALIHHFQSGRGRNHDAEPGMFVASGVLLVFALACYSIQKEYPQKWGQFLLNLCHHCHENDNSVDRNINLPTSVSENSL